MKDIFSQEFKLVFELYYDKNFKKVNNKSVMYLF